MKWSIRSSNFIEQVSSPKSFFVDEFTPSALRAFTVCVNDAVNLGQGILPLYIESTGGSSFILNGFLSIIDSARERGMKVSTVVSGSALSAGAFLFLYGDKGYRFIGSAATLMLHEAQLSELLGKFSEVKSFVNSFDKIEEPFYNRINKHLGKKPKWLENKLKKMQNNDWFLTAQEAYEEGFADHIHTPVFTLDIDTKISIS